MERLWVVAKKVAVCLGQSLVRMNRLPAVDQAELITEPTVNGSFA